MFGLFSRLFFRFQFGKADATRVSEFPKVDGTPRRGGKREINYTGNDLPRTKFLACLQNDEENLSPGTKRSPVKGNEKGSQST